MYIYRSSILLNTLLRTNDTIPGSALCFPENDDCYDDVEDYDDDGGEDEADDGKVDHEPGHSLHVHVAGGGVNIGAQDGEGQHQAGDPGHDALHLGGLETNVVLFVGEWRADCSVSVNGNVDQVEDGDVG